MSFHRNVFDDLPVAISLPEGGSVSLPNPDGSCMAASNALRKALRKSLEPLDGSSELVVQPLWNIWVRQLGWWHSQYVEK